MLAERSPSPEEFALLSLSSDAPLPAGGQPLRGKLLGGADTNSSANEWTKIFNPLFAARLDVTFHPGSFNLRVEPLSWESPWSQWIGDRDWEFCPVIIEERAIGLAVRANRDCPDLLEVASPVHLRTALGGLAIGTQVNARLLAGRPLW
jgi:hypothetical protein